MDIFFSPDMHMHDSRLVYQFFTLFSVMEYALKEIGYARLRGSDGVEANWDGFVAELNIKFDWQDHPELIESVRFLFKNPPRKQVLLNGHLDWKNSDRPPKISDNEWLKRLVKTVRNNLFHGGKRPFDPERDSKLLQSCIRVLLSWASLHPEIERVVHSAYDALPVYVSDWNQGSIAVDV